MKKFFLCLLCAFFLFSGNLTPVVHAQQLIQVGGGGKISKKTTYGKWKKVGIGMYKTQCIRKVYHKNGKVTVQQKPSFFLVCL